MTADARLRLRLYDHSKGIGCLIDERIVPRGHSVRFLEGKIEDASAFTREEGMLLFLFYQDEYHLLFRWGTFIYMRTMWRVDLVQRPDPSVPLGNQRGQRLKAWDRAYIVLPPCGALEPGLSFDFVDAQGQRIPSPWDVTLT